MSKTLIGCITLVRAKDLIREEAESASGAEAVRLLWDLVDRLNDNSFDVNAIAIFPDWDDDDNTYKPVKKD